jgi:hypothetical protein
MLNMIYFYFGKIHANMWDFRSLIKPICSWTRTKIMWLQNIKHFCMLPTAPLYRVYFSPHLRNRPINQSFLQLVRGLRLVNFILFFHSFFTEYDLVFIRMHFWYPCSYVLQQQLQALLEILSSTEPHYIRCVKPNNLLKPAIFEHKNVLQQLRCGVSLLALLSWIWTI